MPKPADLDRCLAALDQESTIIAVIEMSHSSWLVAGVVPGEMGRNRPKPRAFFPRHDRTDALDPGSPEQARVDAPAPAGAPGAGDYGTRSLAYGEARSDRNETAPGPDSPGPDHGLWPGSRERDALCVGHHDDGTGEGQKPVELVSGIAGHQPFESQPLRPAPGHALIHAGGPQDGGEAGTPGVIRRENDASGWARKRTGRYGGDIRQWGWHSEPRTAATLDHTERLRPYTDPLPYTRHHRLVRPFSRPLAGV